MFALALSACSGGGSSSSPVTPATSKPTGAASKVAVKISIPAPATSPAGIARVTAGSHRVRPALISAASNGLAILVYSTAASPVLVDEQDFDISSTSSFCTVAAGGGRSCAITITEPAGTFDFVISTYANPPGANGTGFAGAPTLDSGNAGDYTLTSGTTATITVTLGGTVASLQLSVPPSIDAYGATSAPVGITAFDAAGEVIISSVAYSAPIALAISSSVGTSGVGLSVNGGAAAATVSSTAQTDVVTLAYPGGRATNPGDVLTVTATLAGASTAAATAKVTPLYVTAASPNVAAAVAPTLSLPSSSVSDVVTLREGASFSGTFTIAPDATNGCVSNGSSTASVTSPILFTSGQTTSTTPPATLTASGGAASLTVATGGYATPAGGCVYHISDGSGTSVTFKIVAYLPGSYTACPGTHLYVNNDNTGLISYALPLTSSSAGTQLETQDQTVWLAFDPQCNAYIPDYYGYQSEYTSPYTGAPAANFTQLSGSLVYGIALDNAGHYFVDETNANQVVEYSSFSNSATILNTFPVTSPYAIAFDSQANLYVGGSTGISVFAYPYSSTTPTQTILSGVNIQGIAFDANNDLFAVGQNTLYELSAPYTTIRAQNTTGLSTPLGLAVDPATADVYVPNYGNNTITGYAPPYTGAPFATVSGSLPDADAIGP